MTIPIPEIRQYLTNAYSDDEFGTLCSDYFRDVYESFAAGMTKLQKIGLLLDYCQRREQLPNLLAVLERDRTQQFRTHFAREVKLPSGPTAPATQPQPKPRWLWPAVGGLVGLAAIVVAAIIATGGDFRKLIALVIREPALGIGSTMVAKEDDTTLVYVPAGEFLMGSADSDPDAASDEKPLHTVYLDAYWIDRTEVTKDQYQKCVAAGKCAAPSCSLTGQGSHPVVCVSWQDATNYCAWAGRRLPTEAEWEKAARGTDGRKYPWGNEAPDCGRLNYLGKDGGCVGTTAAAGSYPSGASPCGALDMAGNVWEWVADWYDGSYYASSPAQNPTGPDAGQEHVLRGGSWHFAQEGVRAALRHRWEPAERDNGLGFRCARS